VKTGVEPLSVLPAVRDVLAEMDARIPIAEVRPLREVWSASMARERFVLTLLGLFGVLALSLATVGVYAVTAQLARRRTQEIGIRMALGANASEVVRMMLGQGFGMIALGLAVGVAAALVSTRALSSLLFEVEPTDPATLVAVVALLGFVGLAASYLPARRATAADPVRSMRME
jgi:ABC-type antimicrobial peptide transport system permease subunit